MVVKTVDCIGNELTRTAKTIRMERKEALLMETMNIALPESMKQFVQERVSQGGYSSVSEYVS